MADAKSASGHLYWSRAPTKPEGSVAPRRLDAASASADAAATPVTAAAPWCPLFKWGQRGPTVYLTIFVPCLKGDDDVQLDIAAGTLTFTARRVAELAGGVRAERSYRLHLLLFDEVEPSRCVHHLRHDHVRVELAKRRTRPWRSLQASGVPKHPNERPDFDHCDDSSGDDAPGATKPAARKAPARARAPALLGRLSGLLEPAEALLLAAVALYAVACPYSKVEESFNMQATHDFLFHTSDLHAYDHYAFPGVVPRSFAGALCLAAISAPAVLPLHALGFPKWHAQLVVRLVLGVASACAMLSVRRAARARFGRGTADAHLLLCLCQFHPLFYASRTLPNTFGTLASAIATEAWLRGRPSRALAALTAGTVVFRADLLLLLAPYALLVLATRRLSLPVIVATGIAAAAASLLATVPLDSLLWGRLLWPEAQVLLANTIGNMSAAYGTAPWHWYFSSALPRALALAYPLALLSPFVAPHPAAELALIPLSAVALYSFLPHKELRFILYAVPPLNVAAAAALAALRARIPAAPRTRRRTALAVAGRLGLAAAVVASLALAAASLGAARLNYPGAHALMQLHRTTRADRRTRVHIGEWEGELVFWGGGSCLGEGDR
jgi:alpha-1,6-mannosyltransferase